MSEISKKSPSSFQFQMDSYEIVEFLTSTFEAKTAEQASQSSALSSCSGKLLTHGVQVPGLTVSAPAPAASELKTEEM